MPSIEKSLRRESKRKRRDKIRGEQQEPKVKTKRVRVRDE
jgi:hypothetical protein